MADPLSDAQIDAIVIVAAMQARADAAGQTLEQWLDAEYRRVTPWWRRVGHRLWRWRL